MKQKTEAYIRMKTTGTTIVLIVLALLLSGCAADSTLIDEQKNLVVSCLNDHDLDGLHVLMYPNAISKEELEAGDSQRFDFEEASPLYLRCFRNYHRFGTADGYPKGWEEWIC